MKQKITVIGGANIDITAQTQQAYKPFDSNPSKISISFGGVGRNIAHNLALLGCDVYFLTAFSNDDFGMTLQNNCQALGLHTDCSPVLNNARSNYFLCINNPHGEMQAGAADMTLLNNLTPEHLLNNLTLINGSAAVVADCNLRQDCLQTLARHIAVPLFIDATSAAKAVKIKPLLPWTNDTPLTVKVNQIEACELSGINNNVEQMALWFIRQGVHHIYITMGAKGVACHDGTAFTILPSEETHVVNATGAGDAFMAGVVQAELNGMDIKVAAQYGIRLATITLQCNQAVNNNIKSLNISQL